MEWYGNSLCSNRAAAMMTQQQQRRDQKYDIRGLTFPFRRFDRLFYFPRGITGY